MSETRTSTPPGDQQMALIPNRAQEDRVVPGVNVPTHYPQSTKHKRKLWTYIAIAAAVLAVLILAVFVPVYFTVIKPRNRSAATSQAPSAGGGSKGGSGGTGSNNPSSPSGVVSGGDGSVITLADGSKVTYSNPLGGTWYYDPQDPFNNNAQAQSYSPPLNQSWRYGVDRIYGVNVGGLFQLEPFISPALFQKYPGTHDEWSLSLAMAADTASGGLDQLEEHYKTFYTEEDFIQMVGAGINWIRLPIPYFAIETYPGEPFLARTSWKYILQVLQWCRKYGIRVKIDLHSVPGSQNGYNHSGKQGQINFLAGVMGYANAQRSLEYIRTFTEFFAQPEWKDVVQIFGIVNEARASVITKETLSSFFLQTHDLIRNITGYGEGNGPWISFHDGFTGLSQWAGDFEGADRMVIDDHPYFAFNGQANTDPLPTWPARACNAWGNSVNHSMIAFGMTIAGEFSNAINDCGLFLNGVPGSANYGGNCDDWEIWEKWTPQIKAGLKEFALASMDALQNWFFWTWKIGNSSEANSVRAPLWSYQLGLDQGWMPKDPREANGKCADLGVEGDPFPGTFAQPYMTGGAGAGTVAASVRSAAPWPPAEIAGAGAAVSSLPFYTATGSIITLPPLTFSAASPSKTINSGDGWANDADTKPAVTPIAGCTYPDPWDATSVAVPPLCTGPAVARRYPAPLPRMTPI